jgi:urease gamma subunit
MPLGGLEELSMPDVNATPLSEWRSTRFWLAIGVTVLAVMAVTTLAFVVIHNAKDRQDSATSAQNVLSSVLPLLGTWVGTILAYYFSKENFEAATKSVTELAKQITPQEKLKSALAKDKMIPRDQMFVESSPPDRLRLAEILDNLERVKKGNRVPILGEKAEARYILHRSIIDSFLSAAARSGKPPAEIMQQTVQNLLDQDPKMKVMAQSFNCVRQDATLADALDAMNKIGDCQDVFVTQTGSKDEPVLGWITNVVIQENAKV